MHNKWLSHTQGKIMTIFDKWVQLAARMKPQFITKLAFVLKKNAHGLFTILIKQWWPLILLLIAAYTEYLRRFFNAIMVGNGLSHLLTAKFATTILFGLAIGMWVAVVIISAHPSKFPKKEFYRTHLLLFLCITILVTTTYLYYIALPIGFFPTSSAYPTPRYSAFAELYLIFSCFFLLDAHVSVNEYLRALFVLPIKLLLFNLPIAIPLYLILILLHAILPIFSLLIFVPFFITICEIVYKLTINNNYEDYYPDKATRDIL